MDLDFETTIIETPYGRTNLMTIGRGPRVLVVHGGPGFSHHYLKDCVLPHIERRTFVFYDQPSYRSCELLANSFSPLTIFGHFRWLANFLSKDTELGILAHSWGSLVFVGALAEPSLKDIPEPNLSDVLLINPMPINSNDFNLCRKKLIRRFSFYSYLKLFLLHIVNADGSKVMQHLMPYYVNDPSKIQHKEIHLEKKSYLELLKQFNNYNYDHQISSLPNINVMISDHDFIQREHLSSLLLRASHVFTIENSGHFPFWENEEKFHNVMHSVFT